MSKRIGLFSSRPIRGSLGISVIRASYGDRNRAKMQFERVKTGLKHGKSTNDNSVRACYELLEMVNCWNEQKTISK
jgi:hypothetical protein